MWDEKFFSIPTMGFVKKLKMKDDVLVIFLGRNELVIIFRI